MKLIKKFEFSTPCVSSFVLKIFKMRFLALYLVVLSMVIVESHEFKGFTLKFLYQVLTGDFSLKRKDKVEKNVTKNHFSNYLGK